MGGFVSSSAHPHSSFHQLAMLLSLRSLRTSLSCEGCTPLRVSHTRVKTNVRHGAAKGTVGITHIMRNKALNPEDIEATRKVHLVLIIPTINPRPHNNDPTWSLQLNPSSTIMKIQLTKIKILATVEIPLL